MKLALELARWTGQRQSDVLKLTWTAYKDGRLTFRQRKRKRKLDMPVPPPLKAFVDNLPKRAATILTAADGKPWTTESRPST